jgi:hypothetical protein
MSRNSSKTGGLLVEMSKNSSKMRALLVEMSRNSSRKRGSTGRIPFLGVYEISESRFRNPDFRVMIIGKAILYVLYMANSLRVCMIV